MTIIKIENFSHCILFELQKRVSATSATMPMLKFNEAWAVCLDADGVFAPPLIEGGDSHKFAKEFFRQLRKMESEKRIVIHKKGIIISHISLTAEGKMYLGSVIFANQHPAKA